MDFLNTIRIWLSLFVFLEIVIPKYAQTQSHEGEFIYLEQFLPGAIDPLGFNTPTGRRLSILLSEGLIRRGLDGTPLPALADFEEKSFTEVKFTIRKDAVWHHDGMPVTTRDIQMTIDIIKNPQSVGIHPELKRKVELIEDLVPHDQRQFTIRTSHPLPHPALVMSFGIVPAHHPDLQKGYLTPSDSSFHGKPQGTGYYRINNRYGREVVLKRHESHPGERAFFDSIRMRVIEDPYILITDLTRRPETRAAIEIPLDMIPLVRAAGIFVLYPYNTLSYYALVLNCRFGYLSDKSIRRALGQAINREHLIQVHLGGNARPISGPFAPGSWAYNFMVPRLKFDPTAAEQILHTRQIYLRILTGLAGENPSSALRLAIDGIKQSLENVGVTVQIEETTEDSLTSRLEKGDFSLAFVRCSFDDEAEVSYLFHSDPRIGRFNFGGYRNPQVDELINQTLKASVNFGTRKKLKWELHRIIAEDCPFIFLWSPHSMTAIQKDVHVTKIDPYEYFTFFHEWYLEEQK